MNKSEPEERAEVKRVSIEIDKQFLTRLLDGVKTSLSSPERYGRAGQAVSLKVGYDLISAKILLVLKAPLWFIKSHLWLKEGHNGPEAFETYWVSKQGKWTSNRKVFIHIIELS